MSSFFAAATGSLLLLFVINITIGANPCVLPKDVGPCRAAMPRYYYDALSGQCEQFLYGGCQGNDNNFETMTECETECGVSGADNGEVVSYNQQSVYPRPGYVFQWECKDMDCNLENCRMIEHATQKLIALMKDFMFGVLFLAMQSVKENHTKYGQARIVTIIIIKTHMNGQK